MRLNLPSTVAPFCGEARRRESNLSQQTTKTTSMKTTEITNTTDIIDSRDIIARIEYLESEQADLLMNEDGETVAPEELSDEARKAFHAWEEENAHELDALRSLRDEAESSPDWEYGETLIRESYFEDYARELAEDCGDVPKDLKWPLRCIDWEQAARELKMDYTSISFDGVEYFIRS